MQLNAPSGMSSRRRALALLLGAVMLVAGALFLILSPREEAALEDSSPTRAPSQSGLHAYKNRALWRSTTPAGGIDEGAPDPPVHGIVYSVDGSAVAGAEIMATTFEIAGNRPTMAGVARTDERGTFEMSLPEGMYQVTASMRGYGPASMTARSGEQLTLVMQPSGVIVGRVIDDRGASVPRFAIDVLPLVGGDMPAMGPLWSKGFDSPEGSFRVEELPPWGIYIRATAVGFAPAFSERVKTFPGETRTVDLTLTKGCIVSGTVEDAKGAPLPNVLVNAEMQTAAGTLSQSAIEIAEDSVSDAEGRFLLKHVPAGVILVRGYDDTHAVSTTTMDTTSCDRLSPIRLVMSAGGSVVGVARRSDGTLLPGARLSLAQRAIGFVNTKSDEEGRFRFEQIPAGAAQIELDFEGRRTWVRTQVSEGEITDQDVTLFDIGPGELRGRVLANGKPLPGARLAVMSNQGRTKGINSFYPVTNRDGEYHLDAIPVGAYLVTLFGMKQSDGVHVKSDEVATLDLNVAPRLGPKKKLPLLGDFTD